MKGYKEANMIYRYGGICTLLISEDVPCTYIENQKWKKIMKVGMESLHKNQTWELVQLPKGKKAISCKWVQAKKEDTAGVRFKAILMAKGYTQKEWIDDNEVFYLVVKNSYIQILLALVA